MKRKKMSLNYYYYFYIHFYIYLAISSYYCIHLSHAQQASCAYGEYYNATSNKCYQCDCSHWMMSNGHNKIACDTAPEGTAEFYGYHYFLGGKNRNLNGLLQYVKHMGPNHTNTSSYYC